MLSDFLKETFQLLAKTGHERTQKIKKNIIYTFLIKGTSVLIGFMLIPLTIHYISPAQYGIWIIIYSFVSWINTFDIGLSNGLRNKLAHYFALNETKDVLKYISTTYALLSLVASIIFVVFLISSAFINWNQLFNIENAVDYSIRQLILITLVAFSIQFILQPINSILTAIHQPFKVSLILLMGQFLAFITIYILQLFTVGNLFTVVIVAACSPLFVMLLSSIYLFSNSLKSFVPKFNFIDLKIAKNLLSSGGIFFILQIGALVLYETDNIVIALKLNPVEVTIFNIAFKYFSTIVVVFSIIITPFWSAFTDAYAKNDLEWIKRSIKKMRVLWFLLSILSLILYLLSDFFYKIWIGDKIRVPDLLSLMLAVNVIMQNWVTMHTYLLNGIGKLRVQLIVLVFTGVANIPLSVLLINQIGIAGTVLANIIVWIIMSIILVYQCRLILNKRALGIWDK